MPLNKSKGNMYEFVTHTWNPIKGKCFHNCSYCYMKRWGEQKEVHIDEKEMNTNLGKDNFIFVGSSTDMFAKDVPSLWIERVLNKCQGADNKYLFQTKNPERLLSYMREPILSHKCVACTTLESDRYYSHIYKNAPSLNSRVSAMRDLSMIMPVYITVEPILDFKPDAFICMIDYCRPDQVNIGADSGGHNLPEPNAFKILYLIKELKKFTKVVQKSNLKRLLK